MAHAWTDPDEWQRSRQFVAAYAALLALAWVAFDALALLDGAQPGLVAAVPGWLGPAVAAGLIAWGLWTDAPVATLVGSALLALLLVASTVTLGPVPAALHWPLLVLLFLSIIAEVGRARYGAPENEALDAGEGR